MFSGLQDDQLKGALEAMLFVTDEPVGTIALADMLEVEPAEVERALVDLRAQFEEENRGVQLREVAGGWRLATHPAYHELIERYVLSWDTRKLSQAALETLAVVAYSQPVTRAGVASVRGVNSDSSINSLVEKGLVREAGTADAPGNPMLYATTRAFLEKFGLRSVADLPDLDQFAPDDEVRAFIQERLSATREASGGALAPKGEADILDDIVLGDDDPQVISLDAMSAAADALGVPEAKGAPAMPETGDVLVVPAVAPSLSTESAYSASPADPQSLLADAMAAGFGLTEKIDFDSLVFETDDE